MFVLEPYKEAFDLHSDGMYQMAKFAAASSTESRRKSTVVKNTGMPLCTKYTNSIFF